ncbi:MAG: ribonucleoside triphosphate reductase, partial [Caldicoprobacterales bacterium]
MVIEYQVRKRDGQLVAFNIEKISKAIQRAFEAQSVSYSKSILELLALRTTAEFEACVNKGIISVEQIQDAVEFVLIQAGYAKVARAYILYRKQREKARNALNTLIDYRKVVDDYVKNIDWRVKENSTVSYSVGGLILSNSGAVTANYWLSEIFDEDVANAHRNGDMHIHDLSMLTGYCAGWSLHQLISEGLGGVQGKTTSAPAKHLATLCNQMVNFLGIMQNEWAGAQAFSSFDTYLAPFVRTDNLNQDQVQKCVESFIYGVNTPSRWGTQAPFTNITLDWTIPKDLAERPAIVGGKMMEFTYGDCQREMDMINKAFLTVMLEGDYEGRGFQYPIPTYSITKDFNWSDTENNKLLFDLTAKYGTPYFS